MYGRPCNPSTNVPNNMLPYSISPHSPYPLKNEPVYPTINAIPTLTQTVTQESNHPLQGIPFKLAPALEICANVQQDPIFDDVKRTLERVKNILASKDFDYDFTLERNFLREVSEK